MRGFSDTITIRKLRVADVSVQSDGSWSFTEDDQSVRGSFHQTLMYDRDPELGGQYGQRIVAIARLPKDADIIQGDQIVIAGKNDAVDGTYEVNAVMFTPTHLRAEVRRISV